MEDLTGITALKKATDQLLADDGDMEWSDEDLDSTSTDAASDSDRAPPSPVAATANGATAASRTSAAAVNHDAVTSDPDDF